MNDIVTALIAGGSSIVVGVLTLIGVIFTSSKTNKKIENRLEVSQAVTDTKIEELTREVREHNNFASRIPVIEEQIRVANHRIDDLEHLHKPKQ